MYKVMLVEDDDAVRYVYSKMKAWGKYGFCIEQEAANGSRALEAMQKHPADVIFTDIRMPFMDGITLMKHVTESYPDVLFVFISSYNEFEYAREGLRMGAVDYVIKPMGEEDLDGVLQRVRELLLAQNKNGVTGLAKRLLPEKDLQDALIQNIFRYMDENMHCNLTIEEVADEMGLNKDYLGRQIKHKTGLSFRNLYNQIKMEYAKPLIKSGQYKVYEIGELLGYASPDYFSQLFKNVVGMTPAEYKKLNNV